MQGFTYSVRLNYHYWKGGVTAAAVTAYKLFAGGVA